MMHRIIAAFENIQSGAISSRQVGIGADAGRPGSFFNNLLSLLKAAGKTDPVRPEGVEISEGENNASQISHIGVVSPRSSMFYNNGMTWDGGTLKEQMSNRAESGEQKSGIEGQRLEVGDQRSEVGGQRSEVGDQRSEVRGQTTEVGGRRSEVGGQSSEVRDKKSAIRGEGIQVDSRSTDSKNHRLAADLILDAGLKHRQNEAANHNRVMLPIESRTIEYVYKGIENRERSLGSTNIFSTPDSKAANVQSGKNKPVTNPLGSQTAQSDNKMSQVSGRILNAGANQHSIVQASNSQSNHTTVPAGEHSPKVHQKLPGVMPAAVKNNQAPDMLLGKTKDSNKKVSDTPARILVADLIQNRSESNVRVNTHASTLSYKSTDNHIVQSTNNKINRGLSAELRSAGMRFNTGVNPPSNLVGMYPSKAQAPSSGIALSEKSAPVPDMPVAGTTRSSNSVPETPVRMQAADLFLNHRENNALVYRQITNLSRNLLGIQITPNREMYANQFYTSSNDSRAIKGIQVIEQMDTDQAGQAHAFRGLHQSNVQKHRSVLMPAGKNEHAPRVFTEKAIQGNERVNDIPARVPVNDSTLHRNEVFNRMNGPIPNITRNLFGVQGTPNSEVSSSRVQSNNGYTGVMTEIRTIGQQFNNQTGSERALNMVHQSIGKSNRPGMVQTLRSEPANPFSTTGSNQNSDKGKTQVDVKLQTLSRDLQGLQITRSMENITSPKPGPDKIRVLQENNPIIAREQPVQVEKGAVNATRPSLEPIIDSEKTVTRPVSLQKNHVENIIPERNFSTQIRNNDTQQAIRQNDNNLNSHHINPKPNIERQGSDLRQEMTGRTYNIDGTPLRSARSDMNNEGQGRHTGDGRNMQPDFTPNTNYLTKPEGNSQEFQFKLAEASHQNTAAMTMKGAAAKQGTGQTTSFAEFPKQAIEDIAKAVSLRMQNDISEIRFRLKPEYLGELFIKMRMENGKMTAKVDVTNAAVKAIFEGQLPQLREALIARGIEVQRFDILTGGQSNQAEERGEQPGWHSRYQGRKREENEPETAKRTQRFFEYNTIELIL